MSRLLTLKRLADAGVSQGDLVDFMERFGAEVRISEEVCASHSEFDWLSVAKAIFVTDSLEEFCRGAVELYIARRARGQLRPSEYGRETEKYSREFAAHEKDVARLFAWVYNREPPAEDEQTREKDRG